MNRPNEIPVFFASDDNYIPCLAVAIHSLEKNASKKNNYKLIILHSGMSEKGKQEITDSSFGARAVVVVNKED